MQTANEYISLHIFKMSAWFIGETVYKNYDQNKLGSRSAGFSDILCRKIYNHATSRLAKA